MTSTSEEWVLIDAEQPSEWDEPRCDYCERDGHTFRSCPARDDMVGGE